MWLNQGLIWNRCFAAGKHAARCAGSSASHRTCRSSQSSDGCAPIKNHYLFLEVAARIAAARPDVRFLVVGDGELGTAIRARAGSLNLSIG